MLQKGKDKQRFNLLLDTFNNKPALKHISFASSFEMLQVHWTEASVLEDISH